MDRRHAFFLIVTMAAAGCGSQEHANPATSPEVSFAAEIQPILAATCGQCHGVQGGGNTGLDLRPDHAWAALVSSTPRRAFGCTTGSDMLVEPGSPETSVLWRRISGAADCSPMPPSQAGGPLVTSHAADVDRIAEWIRQGARNN